MVSKKFVVRSLIAASVFSLVACGGGGSSKVKVTPPNIIPVNNVDPSITQVDETISVGQSTELLLVAPDDDISNVLWTQIAGESVEFYAKNSKVIGFTPLQAGEYSFQVAYTENGSAEKTLTLDFTVQNEKSLLSARLGHAVAEGNGVSLISYSTLSDDGNLVARDSLRWEQKEGASVTFTESNTDGEVAVFFDAPNVDKDQLLQFTVSGTVNGETVSDDIAILVENSDIEVETNNQQAPFNNRIADVFLYNPNSAAGQKLIDCVYSNKARYSASCTFNQTPLIAHVSETPSVDDIMDRVIVSHQWMGDQFKKFLETYDNEHNDFKNLLRATTAIVLSYDVRPSFYHPYTGAIYLDPSDLWETPAQRDTINQAPDYRASFGNELQFEMPWRYVKNNEYANYYSPISLRLERELSASLYDFAALLYHELAHANDYFPSESWNTVVRADSLLTTVNSLFNNQAIQSDALQRALPLDDGWATGEQNEMTKLGQVRFQNPDLITEEQKAYTKEDVANLFKTEGAPQFYSYSSTREDYAILFDGFMMKARYGIHRDVAVSDQNYSSVAWGQRGREGESWIKPRVQFVAERVLPEFTEITEVIDNLPAPIPFDINKTWNGNLVMAEQAQPSSKNKAAGTLKHNIKRDSRLIPKDGEARHGSGRKFIY
ncbi:hypothetical protein AADZ91_04340 [Colwelliaceae bacterium 6441]